MTKLRGIIALSLVLALTAGFFLAPPCFAARGGASGVINSTGSGTVVKARSGKVLSIVLIGTSAPAEVAIFDFDSTSPPSSTLVWEGRVATANDSYTHTFETPLECVNGIVVQVANGKAFLEFE